MAGVVFGAVGDFLCPPDRPSPIFTTFGCLINGIGAIWAIVVLAGSGGAACESRTRTWLILGVVSLILNIVFCVYLYMRFAQKIADGDGTSKAAHTLLMYDWGVCVYFLFIIWLIIWMVLAGTYAGRAGAGDSCGGMLSALIIFFVLYLIIGVILVIFSLATACCNEPRWKQNQRGQVAAAPAPAPPHPGRPVVQAQPAPRAQPQQRQPQSGGLFGRVFGGGTRNNSAAAQPQPQPAVQPAAPAPQQTYAQPPPANPAYQPQHA